jgi:hypothetical protein
MAETWPMLKCATGNCCNHSGDLMYKRNIFLMMICVFSLFFGISSEQAKAARKDTRPDQFYFNDQSGATRNTVVTSNTITVSGITVASPISITTGGTYSVNDGLYTSAAGSVTNGATVKVRVTSSPSYSRR